MPPVHDCSDPFQVKFMLQRWRTFSVPGLMATVLPVFLLTGTTQEPKKSDRDTGPVRFTEHLIKDKYGYSFGLAAADLDGDGHLDITSVDTVNNIMYWFANDGKGNFTRQIVCEKEEGWLERHAVGDIDGDG